ncbi:MAG: prepilin-type N-terminal cleavage/methylation domain-containing protein [Alphaproteobacteria bacterium]|nr:prepilin-type N-terminal cleavage/methylation domain-containing protein [Alphaproteobacteria bacterium]
MSRNAQRGFTLFELMAAAAAGGIIILAANAFLFKAYGWIGELQSEVEINRHARETLNLLMLGGRSATTGTDGSKNVYGIIGRNSPPASGLRSNYAAQYTSNNLTLTPDKFAGMTVQCIGAAIPLPDCAATEVKSVQGWVGSDVQINSSTRSMANRTIEITAVITDPFEAGAAQSPTQFTEKYRTIGTLNRTEIDP